MKKKLIDEKGRIFGIISGVDILVVLVVAVLAFAVYTRFYNRDATSVAVQNDTFSYQLKVMQVRYSTYESLMPGDVLYDLDNGTRIGVITNVECEPSMAETALADGSFVVAPIENRYDVLISLDAEGLMTGGRYYASRIYEINVNSKVEFYTKYCTTSGYVWTIDGVSGD